MKKRILQLGLLSIISTLLFAQPLYAMQSFSENPSNTWIHLHSNVTNNDFLLHNSGDGNNLEFAASNNGSMTCQAMSINKNGNIGIGTNNAQAKLHIAGDVLMSRPGGARFYIQTPSSDVRMFAEGGKPFLIPEGNVCIGCYSPTHRLTVNGTIKAREILVTNQSWADYVFDENYKLLSLSSLDQFIKENKHLPSIPSAAEIESNGISVGDIQRLQMEKIEELTLYIIQMNEKNNQLKVENDFLNERLQKIENILNIK